MPTTANLWEELCRDLETDRSVLSREKHHVAAKKFKETAAQVFQSGSRRHCEALEIAGDVCQATGYLSDAVADFEEAMVRNEAAGNTAAAARVATKLGLLHDHQGDIERARECYSRALALFEVLHDHSQHAMLLSNMAGLERRAGNFKAAEANYLKAIEVSAGLHGEIHPEVALVCNNLGVAYTEKGDWVRAENLHLRALGIREQAFGAMHPEVAQSLANLAVLFHTSGNLKKAERYYEASLKTYAATLKPGDPEIECVRSNLESLKKQNK